MARKLFAILFWGVLSLTLAACSGKTELNEVVVTPVNPNVAVGTNQQFTATAYFNNGTTQDITNQVVWNSSNGGVATINSSGVATGLSTGVTTIQAVSAIGSSSGVTGNVGSTTMTVVSAILSSLNVTPPNPSLPAGILRQLTATGTYSDGTSFNLSTQVVWTSSNPSVATVSSSGLLTTIAPGSTTVTAVLGGVSGAVSVTVNTATLSSIAVAPVNPAIASIPVGVAQQFVATGTYSDGTTFDITTQVGWTSSDASKATVTGSGLARGVSPGTAGITASSGAVSGTANLTVNSAALQSITIDPPNPSIPVGVNKQLAAVGNYSDGSSFDLTSQAAWSSSNAAVATITTTGLVTSAAAGTTTITAASGGISGSTTLVVSSATLSYLSVSFTTPQANVPVGFSRQLVAVGTYSDGTQHDVTARVTWFSTNTAIATVNSGGLVTGVAAGTANINAALGSVIGGTLVSVSAT